MFINSIIPTLLGCYFNGKIMNMAQIVQNEVHCVCIIAVINKGKSLKLLKCLTKGAQLNEQGTQWNATLLLNLCYRSSMTRC